LTKEQLLEVDAEEVVLAEISIEVTEQKTWNDLDGTNSESKDCDPTPSEKVTSKETQISLEKSVSTTNRTCQ
jgi:hypothetical protein